MKKVLILTVTAGNGHNACARSMKEKLESMDEEVEVKIVDLLKSFSNANYVWLADKGYNIAVSKILWAYDMFYNHYKRSKPEKRFSCGATKTALSTVDGLLKEIIDFQPDVIYSTHFYGAMALTDLKLVYDLPCKTVVANLDYVNSPFWEGAIGVDYFVIPNEDFIEECVEEGFTREQLLPLGLPVNEKALKKVEKSVAREELGLKQDVFTIMVMFGGGLWSGGMKIFKGLIKALKGRKAQVIMINGRNEKDYAKIEKMKFDDGITVLNVGFTDKIPLYLSASDIILNKFGGTSVTEMINASLPMLITEKIPAQEKYNLKYMKEKGVALSFKNSKELKENVIKLMDNPSLREEMAEKTQPLKRDAINEVAKVLLSFDKADYNKLQGENIDFSNVKKVVGRAIKQADKREKQKAKEIRKEKRRLKRNYENSSCVGQQ